MFFNIITELYFFYVNMKRYFFQIILFIIVNSNFITEEIIVPIKLSHAVKDKIEKKNDCRASFLIGYFARFCYWPFHSHRQNSS